jgi:hypothetical protein
MIEPTWKLISDTVVWREWPDGKQESCLVTTPEYLAWLDKGGVPLPADEVTE